MVEIVPRLKWGAVEPKLAPGALRLPVHNVFAMNTHSKPCFNNIVCMGTIRLLQHVHMNKQNQRDIRYNFVVSADGGVYEGRGWRDAPLLPRDHSRLSNSSILIGYIGDYNADEMPVAMSKAGYDLIDYGLQQGYIAHGFLFYDIMRKLEEGPTPHQMPTDQD